MTTGLAPLKAPSRLAPRKGPEDSQESSELALRTQEAFDRSFATQKADSNLSHTRTWVYLEDTTGNYEKFFRMSSGLFVQTTEQGLRLVTIRGIILGGAMPIPETKKLPTPYSGSLYELIDEVQETVHATIESFDYNALRPFIQIIQQVHAGKSEVKIDSSDEKWGAICTGIGLAIVKNLKEKHNVDGMLAAERPVGQDAFTHAGVIVQCNDGYVFLDTKPLPKDQIFAVKFGQTTEHENFSLTATKPGSITPLILTQNGNDFEYRVDLANADDLVAQCHTMSSPLMPENDFAFPIVRYDAKGNHSQMIWISPVKRTITLKDMNASPGHRARELELSFQEVIDGALDFELPILYDRSKTTFHIPLKSLKKQIVTFVKNVDIIDFLLYEAPPVPGSI